MSFKPINLELSSVLAQWIKDPVAQESIVLAVWKRAVGEAVTQHSTPRALVDGVLVIEFIDPTWGRVLEEMTPDLLGRLNGALGKRIVRSIEWRLREEQP